MRLWRASALTFTVFLYVGRISCQEKFHTFKTEPTFRSPILHVNSSPSALSQLEDGYFFMSPFLDGHWAHYGPHIYEKTGTVIWNAQDISGGSKRATGNFRPCDYLGAEGQHVQWVESTVIGMDQKKGGHWFFDNTYTQVTENFASIDGMEAPNGHELNTLPGGKSFMQVLYHHQKLDLTTYLGPKDGELTEACFQEVDIEERKATFTWCLLDHIPIWDTMMYMNVEGQTSNYTENYAGKGNWLSPWDIHHINSADKNVDGDYIVSIRNLCQIIKVAGNQSPSGEKPGTILWRLGGVSGDIGLKGFSHPLPFSVQHHAAFISSNSTGDIISVHNNAYRLAKDHTKIPASAQFISVNNITKVATLVREYNNPHGVQTHCSGSVQKLSNGNVMVGWGCNPQLTEFAEDGTVLLDAHWGSAAFDVSYRSFSYPWKGYPNWSPKLLAYSLTCDATSPIIAYVSWNGATEVAGWKLYARAFDKGPWIPAGTYKKDGFETMMNLTETWTARQLRKLTGFVPFVAVEAIDASGQIIAGGRAETKTFVPKNPVIKKNKCDESGCAEPQFFAYNGTMSNAAMCEVHKGTSIGFLGVVLIALAALAWLTMHSIFAVAKRRHWRPTYETISSDDYSDDLPKAKDAPKAE